MPKIRMLRKPHKPDDVFDMTKLKFVNKGSSFGLPGEQKEHIRK